METAMLLPRRLLHRTTLRRSLRGNGPFDNPPRHAGDAVGHAWNPPASRTEYAGRNAGIQAINEAVAQTSGWVRPLRQEIGRVIVGQQNLIDRLLVGLVGNGHLLLEGVPGLAKTLSLKTLAAAAQAKFQRMQFTPDMLPADIVGTMIYNPRDGYVPHQARPGLQQSDSRRRNQSCSGQGAERVAGSDAGAPGHARRRHLSAARAVPGHGDAEPDRAGRHLPAARSPGRPVHAQDPRRLPESQLRSGRFWTRMASTGPTCKVTPVVTAEDISTARGVVNTIYIDEKVKDYIVDLVLATRDPEAHGVRAQRLHSIRRVAASHDQPHPGRRGLGLPQGRGYVTPQDMKDLASDVLRHRVIVSYEAEAENITSEDIIRRFSKRCPCREREANEKADAMNSESSPRNPEEGPPDRNPHQPARERLTGRRVPFRLSRVGAWTSTKCASTSPATKCGPLTGT